MSAGASSKREHRLVVFLATAAVGILLALTMHHFLPQAQADADHCFLCALMHGMDTAVSVEEGESPADLHLTISQHFDTVLVLRPSWPSWSHRGPPNIA